MDAYSDDDDLRMQKEADEFVVQCGFGTQFIAYLRDRAWEARYYLRHGHTCLVERDQRWESVARELSPEEQADTGITLRHLRTRIARLRRLAARSAVRTLG
jgi:hypothetical protein